jgi:four helix bundle protein
MKGSAVSITANIAKGVGRVLRGNYLRFIAIARGSQVEPDARPELAVILRYLKAEVLSP